MKHLGKLLKKHIESQKIKKRDVAEAAHISYNYLSTIFAKPTMDCELWEKLCLASGLNPADAFEVPHGTIKKYSDISAHTTVGSATVTIGAEPQIKEKQALLDLLAEKERLIQVLLAASGLRIGTESEQNT